MSDFADLELRDEEEEKKESFISDNEEEEEKVGEIVEEGIKENRSSTINDTEVEIDTKRSQASA